MGIWQLKTVLPEARMKFEKVFVKTFKSTELQIFRSSFFHSITPEGKKEFSKKLCFILNRGIFFCISCVVCIHRSGNNIEQVL